MKYMKEYGIILIVTFLGECAKAIIPLPIPASIYGLVLMLAALCTHIIKVEDVKKAATFLIEIMPMMFIPAAVGIIAAWEMLRPIFGQVIVIIIISTILVMAVSGRVTQRINKLTERNSG